MKKILKFLKCKDIEEVISKIKSYEISEEVDEFVNLMKKVTEENIKNKDITTVKGKSNLIKFLRGDMGYKTTEEFKVIFLNSASEVIAVETLFKGTVDRSAIYPRVIVEKSLKYATKGVIFVHNHPSGNLEPNRKDKEITLEMQELLSKLDIRLLDHIIISDNDNFSFYDNGLLY